MDDQRFDSLTRNLTGAVSRRAGLRAALGGLLGLAGLSGLAGLDAPEDAEATKKAKRRKRRKHKKKSRSPQTRCSKNSDCTIPGQVCFLDSCTCLWDGKGHPLCGNTCCSDGERCVNGRCNPGCRLPLVNGADYSGCDFSSVQIDDYSLGYSIRLANISLAGANLRGAYLNVDRMENVSFEKADLTNAVIQSSYCMNLTFDGADASGINIFCSGWGPTSFDGATISGAVLNMSLPGGDWDSPDPEPRYSLNNVTAIDASFSLPDRADVTLSCIGANLTGSEFTGTYINKKSTFKDAILDRANFGATYADRSIFNGAKSAKCMWVPPMVQINCPKR